MELFFTGSDDGYLDACGCDDGLLGGLPRRATLLKVLQAKEDGALVLSNGRLIAGHEPLDAMKLLAIVLAMQEMGYCALAVTERELALGREKLIEINGLLGGGGEDNDGNATGGALLGTNLEDEAPVDGSDGPRLPTVPAISRKVKGDELLVLSAISNERAAACRAADPQVTVTDPVERLQAEMRQHPGAARTVVLAQMTIDEAKALAAALPALDVIVVEGSPESDAPERQAIAVGTTRIVTTGRMGKFVVELRLGDHKDGSGAVDYTRHPVGDSLEKTSTIVDLLVIYYRDRLLADKPIERYYARRPPRNGASYAGADEGSCASCHPKAWATWASSKHGRAWQTLVDQDLPPAPEDKKGHQVHAIWDPDCVRCHVTGFGEIGGFTGLDHEPPDAPLRNVGCEACHGPSGDHATRAAAGDPSYPGGATPKIALGAGRLMCVRCHDDDNSPHFEVHSYWAGRIDGEQRPSIAHGREND